MFHTWVIIASISLHIADVQKDWLIKNSDY